MGATAGFFGGLLVDTMTLETLGLTSLLLTIAGYWIGQYGETTGRDRRHAPVLSVFVVTVLYVVGAMTLHAMLGDSVPVRYVLIESLPPTVSRTSCSPSPSTRSCGAPSRRRFLGLSARSAPWLVARARLARPRGASSADAGRRRATG